MVSRPSSDDLKPLHPPVAAMIVTGRHSDAERREQPHEAAGEADDTGHGPMMIDAGHDDGIGGALERPTRHTSRWMERHRRLSVTAYMEPIRVRLNGATPCSG